MTLVSDVIDHTRRHLHSGETRDARNRLDGGIDADDTSLVLQVDTEGIARGVVLGVDLEELYVWDISGQTVTVSRADGGSTAATHASGAMVYVNPKFSAFSILQAVNDELSDLSSPVNGLFQVDTVTIAFAAGTDTYDLTGVVDLIDIIDVTFDANDGTSRHPRLRRGEWNLRRGMDTTAFPSGLALTINGMAQSGQDINVVYKKPYAALSTTAQNVETISGLHASAHDILPLGAAIRLTAGNEVARNFLEQGDTRRADEVPPQARGSAMRALAALRRDRIDAEKARLLAQYPVLH